MARYYYVPVSSYWPYDPVWLVGPFPSLTDARRWFREVMRDPSIDWYGHLSRNVRDNWYAAEPLPRAAVMRRCAYSLRDVDRYSLPPTTHPTLAAIRAAARRQQEYLDATR